MEQCQTPYKYTLIVSQYYHSYHSFIVKFNADTFMENAKSFVAELEKYKRRSVNESDIDYGDLAYKNQQQIFIKIQYQ